MGVLDLYIRQKRSCDRLRASTENHTDGPLTIKSLFLKYFVPPLLIVNLSWERLMLPMENFSKEDVESAEKFMRKNVVDSNKIQTSRPHVVKIYRHPSRS